MEQHYSSDANASQTFDVRSKADNRMSGSCNRRHIKSSVRAGAAHASTHAGERAEELLRSIHAPVELPATADHSDELLCLVHALSFITVYDRIRVMQALMKSRLETLRLDRCRLGFELWKPDKAA